MGTQLKDKNLCNANKFQTTEIECRHTYSRLITTKDLTNRKVRSLYVKAR